ncbi:hypothetical protein [Nostoc sp.]|uniref:hypothetical protein n=1 Tax=Nostoc sp. TaxID=1180 RepID=UPI002FF71D3C
MSLIEGGSIIYTMTTIITQDQLQKLHPGDRTDIKLSIGIWKILADDRIGQKELLAMCCRSSLIG